MRRYEILVYLHYAQSSSILKFPKRVHLVLWGSHTLLRQYSHCNNHIFHCAIIPILKHNGMHEQRSIMCVYFRQQVVTVLVTTFDIFVIDNQLFMYISYVICLSKCKNFSEHCTFQYSMYLINLVPNQFYPVQLLVLDCKQHDSNSILLLPRGW